MTTNCAAAAAGTVATATAVAIYVTISRRNHSELVAAAVFRRRRSRIQRLRLRAVPVRRVREADEIPGEMLIGVRLDAAAVRHRGRGLPPDPPESSTHLLVSPPRYYLVGVTLKQAN